MFSLIATQRSQWLSSWVLEPCKCPDEHRASAPTDSYRASLSACVRLVYTVNLTNSEEYLYGISDVVLWGYAENGIGMIVGCVATLRPLFRRIFNLGGDTTGAHIAPAQSYAKRPTKARADGRDEEWVALNNSKMASVVQGRPLPDSSSEEHILGNGIKVTREIDVESSR